MPRNSNYLFCFNISDLLKNGSGNEKGCQANNVDVEEELTHQAFFAQPPPLKVRNRYFWIVCSRENKSKLSILGVEPNQWYESMLRCYETGRKKLEEVQKKGKDAFLAIRIEPSTYYGLPNSYSAKDTTNELGLLQYSWLFIEVNPSSATVVLRDYETEFHPSFGETIMRAASHYDTVASKMDTCDCPHRQMYIFQVEEMDDNSSCGE